MGINGKDKQDVFDEYFNSENAVIIDGVDVSECEDLTNQLCCEQYLSGECVGQNCYYKKLKRLEAENEELKRKNTILESVTEPQRQEIGKYKDKALKLKQALEDVREMADLCLGRSDCFKCPNYDECEFEDDAEIPTHDVCMPIISKINEVLKDE